MNRTILHPTSKVLISLLLLFILQVLPVAAQESDATTFCSNCGKVNIVTEKVCSHCGTVLTKPAVEQTRKDMTLTVSKEQKSMGSIPSTESVISDKSVPTREAAARSFFLSAESLMNQGNFKLAAIRFDQIATRYAATPYGDAALLMVSSCLEMEHYENQFGPKAKKEALRKRQRKGLYALLAGAAVLLTLSIIGDSTS